MISLLLWSCQEEISGSADPQLLSESQKVQIDRSNIKDVLASKVAKNIAASMGDSEVLNFMTKKADEQFDGDFNFLIEATKDESLNTVSSDFNKRTISFGAVISGANLVDKRVSGNTEDFLDSLARFHPLLQVFIPELSGENQLVQSSDYLVAFVPTVIENNIIPAYDRKGNYFELNSTVIPDKPVIVISENERVVAFSKQGDSASRTLSNDCMLMVRPQPVYENEFNIYYLYIDVLESQNSCSGGAVGGGSGGGGGGSTNPPTALTCERDLTNVKDRLNKYKLFSMETFDAINEGWFYGGQEIEVTVTFGRANGVASSVTKISYPRARDLKDCSIFNCETEWFYIDAEIVTWDKSVYGDTMHYVWTEKDSGTPVEYNNSFTTNFNLGNGITSSQTISVKKTITNNDDPLADSIVEYCDTIGEDNGFIYNTGSIYFQLK